MAEIVCPHCHATVPRDAAFCPGCRSLIGTGGGGSKEQLLVPAGKAAAEGPDTTAKDVVEEAVRASMAAPKPATGQRSQSGGTDPVDPYPTDERPRRAAPRPQAPRAKAEPAASGDGAGTALARAVAFLVAVPGTVKATARQLGALPVAVLIVVFALLGSGGLLYSVGAFESRSAAEPRQVGKAQLLTPASHEVTCAAKASVTAAGKRVTFGAKHLFDGDPKTAWRCAGDGSKQRVTLSFGKPVRVSKLALVPGWATKDPTSHADRFRENGAPTAVTWRFDKTAQRQRIGTPKPSWATVRVDPTVRTTSVTLVIDAVRKGERRAMVAVSEMRVHGYR